MASSWIPLFGPMPSKPGHPAGSFFRRGTLLIVLTLTLATRSSTDRVSEIDRLKKLSGDLPYRICEGRLATFTFAPWSGKQRRDTTLPLLRFRARAGQILTETHKVSRDAPYVLGLAALVGGNTSEAISFFESCVARSSRNSECWNDLAVARHESARLNDSPELEAKALEATDHALAIDPSLAAATFNRGLILNALFLQAAADSEWHRYLQLDSNSGWASEVRARIRAIRRVDRAADWRLATARIETASQKDLHALAIAFPQQSRTSGEGDFLCRWADASLSRNSQLAERYLRVAEILGVELLKHDEHLLYDSVGLIRDAATSGNKRRLQAIARAYADYRLGRQAYGERRVIASIASLTKAEHEFAAVGHPMALAAEYFRANALYDSGDKATSMRLLDDVSLRLPRGYLGLRAQILWERAYILSSSGSLHEALTARMEALRIFEQLGEHENATTMRSSIANILSVLGRTHEAWTLRRRIFAEASILGDAAILEGALNTTARDSMRDSEWGVARSLLHVALLAAPSSARLRADVFKHLAEIEVHESSRFDMVAVRANAFRISDPALRAEALDDLRLIEAVTLRESNPGRAIALLTDTIRFRTSRSRTLWLAPAYIERARASERLGRLLEARSDLRLAIKTIEQQRDAIQRPDLRDSFLDTMRSAFLALIDLDLAAGDFADAFRRSEEMRTYDEIVGHRPVSPYTPEGVAAKLPLRTMLIEHVALDDRLVTMTISRSELHTYITPIGRAGLRAQIDHFRDAIATNDSKRITAESKTLFDALLGSNVADGLGSINTMVLIPDSTTDGVPFAALQNVKTGRYLIEDVSLASSSSVAAFLSRTATPPANEPRALVVGDPAIDRNEFPQLASLPAAALEARTVAAIYNSSALIGRQASKDQVLNEMEKSDIIHIAGHAWSNPHNPDSGFIPLAANGTSSNVLYLREVSKLRLGRKPIVILAGCRTASEALGYGASRSFANAFLAAGSRSVIASLWDANDVTTGVFSTLIHRELRKHDYAPAVALREAQLAMLRSTNSATRAARSWSGFQLLAYADGYE
jgi:CHAT domain-containing protein/tetratricopeptide (TPR) repeat protein